MIVICRKNILSMRISKTYTYQMMLGKMFGMENVIVEDVIVRI